MRNSLALTGSIYEMLHKHLYPGNNLEMAAIMLCHRGVVSDGFRFMVKNVELVSADSCEEQTSTYLSWSFAEYMTPEDISRIDKANLSVFTIHSHPGGYEKFSAIDNNNDKSLFKAVYGWFDDDRPNGSAIMLPDGEIIARIVNKNGRFSPIHTVSVVGDNIQFWKRSKKSMKNTNYGLKVSQTLGKGTFDLLRELRIGVVGCSGTGSVIVELLARNCIGNLVLVDPDEVEEKNLNRIVNTRRIDAKNRVSKVKALKKAIKSMGIGVKVDVYAEDTYSNNVIEALADCDVLFGCVDSATGRYHLECIATAYLIPYFDIGVDLEADGKGKITHADVVTHYRPPQGDSLFSRGVYTTEQVTAESWQRKDPEYYERQRVAGYLAAVGEDQPAVISVNMQAACLAFNDFLARIHNFRLDDNADFAIQRFRLVHGCYLYERSVNPPDDLFKKYYGMGEDSFLIQNLKSETT